LEARGWRSGSQAFCAAVEKIIEDLLADPGLKDCHYLSFEMHERTLSPVRSSATFRWSEAALLSAFAGQKKRYCQSSQCSQGCKAGGDPGENSTVEKGADKHLLGAS
jgi:hypothetical protein